MFERCLKDTHVPAAPWYIVDARSRKWARLQVLEAMCRGMETALAGHSPAVPSLANTWPLQKMPKLSKIPSDRTVEEAQYQEELGRLQKKLGELHDRPYQKQVPVIIAYEGWDAAGKGGNVKRITGHWLPGGSRCAHRQSGTEGKGMPLPMAFLDAAAQDGAYRHF